MLNQNEILEIFKKSQALLTGHFELTSGLHSAQYFQCALVLQYPEYCGLLAQSLKERLGALPKPDFIIGPALGGVTLAYELARAFQVKGIFAERKEGLMQLRRGFGVEPGAKGIVVEDVITTGGSVQEVIQLMKQAGAQILAVGSVVDRSSSTVNFGVPFEPLMKMKVETFQPADCPLCKKGTPVYKPGSRPI
ncbi:MAG: orotate phosphoribosyltransferase [Candidatus Omnitrophica bacterium]|nr:orotate phosphoribosyltransferase [Candidatus Omnitrophota bacterium]